MNRFTEEIQQRKDMDVRSLEQASRSIYDSLQTGSGMQRPEETDRSCAGVLWEICRYFGIEPFDLPDDTGDVELLLPYMTGRTGIMHRRVTLKDAWWNDGAVPLLCRDEENRLYALVPSAGGGYIYWEHGKRRKVTGKNARKFQTGCYCFYNPMPNRAMGKRDFIAFCMHALQRPDIVWVILASVLFALLGMVLPAVNRYIFDTMLPSGTSKEIVGISVLLAGTILVQSLSGLARHLWVLRIGNKIELLVKNALWARLLMLPADFFKRFSTGELVQRAAGVNQICDILGGQLIPTVLASIFSVVYLYQVHYFAPELLWPSLLIAAAVLAVNLATAFLKNRRKIYNEQVESKMSGMVNQFLRALSRIKMTGSEVRAFARWSGAYRKLRMVPGRFVLASSAINGAVVFGGTIVLYILAYGTQMRVSDYIAFQAAFSLFLEAMLSMMSITSQIAGLKPGLELISPILEEIPEGMGSRRPVTALEGRIELNQVHFAYNVEHPDVLDGIQLHIEPGEYVGITGASGCGKSTLLRILLGFEKPQSGTVAYDSMEMSGLELRSLRSRMGVVLQNDMLFAGDIYSNIAVCAPWITHEDAWDALERVGLAEDVRAMPMGIFTVLSEEGGGLSGGQKQLLLIARAIVSHPDIVLFDEATSALDNRTQMLVAEALEKMSCTRIVIAHRLTTLQSCSRIIYMDRGKIAESGTYEELMKRNGQFAAMAQRQLL